QRGEDLRTALKDLLRQEPKLLLLRSSAAVEDEEGAALAVGAPNAEESAGMWHCVRVCKQMGPGTGCDSQLPALYLPLRGGEDEAFGAALIPVSQKQITTPETLMQAQALCDQMGQQLHRAETQR